MTRVYGTNKRVLKILALFVGVALGTMPSYAAAQSLLYDNNAGGAAGIDDASISDAESNLFTADDFSLAVGGTVLSVEWTGVYGLLDTPPAQDDFSIDIFDDVSGSPGSLLVSYAIGNSAIRTDSGFDEPVFGFDVYDYSADIAGFDAAGGQTYWISIRNNTPGSPTNDFFWGILNSQGNSVAGTRDDGWQAEGHRADFRLLGTAIPEPNALILLTAASGLLVAGRRRR